MKILALDLGKFKSTICVLDTPAPRGSSIAVPSLRFDGMEFASAIFCLHPLSAANSTGAFLFI